MSLTRIFLVSLAIPLVGIGAQNKNTYLEQGEKAFARGAYDSAFDLFQQAIDAGESSGRPQFFMGQILESRKKYRESLVYFAQAVDRPLDKNYKTAALWKLVLIHQQYQEYEQCLRYMDRLEAMGVKHENLSKIRSQAEAQLSPEKREARRRVSAALKKETELRSLRKENSFYTEYQDELLEIAKIYEESAAVDVGLRPYLWNAAFYHEKLGNLAAARKIYLSLAEDENSKEKEKAWYKLGVLEKKNGEYEKSLEYFSRAMELKGQPSPAMRYYLSINSAQSNFALGNYEQAIRYAVTAGEFSDGKKKIRMAQLIQCLAFEKIGKYEAKCGALAKEKETSFRAGEKSLLHLLAAAEARRKGNHPEALRRYQAAFLADTAAENLSGDEEEEAGVPGWLLDEVLPVFDYFLEQGRHALVLKMADRYRYLFDEPKYHQPVGMAAFREKDYKTTLHRLRQIENPSPEVREMLHAAMLSLRKFTELADELHREAAVDNASRERVLQELSQKQYAEFLKSIPGETLLRRLQNHPEQMINTPD